MSARAIHAATRQSNYDSQAENGERRNPAEHHIAGEVGDQRVVHRRASTRTGAQKKFQNSRPALLQSAPRSLSWAAFSVLRASERLSFLPASQAEKGPRNSDANQGA